MKKQVKKIVILIISAICLVGFDQWTKYLATATLKGTSGKEVIPNIFSFYYSENRGAAFGMLHGKQVFLMITTMLILIGILYLYMKVPTKKRYIPIHIICITLVSGAIGNFIDRFLLGYVVDFLYFKLIDFPIFNVADCYVTISAACLVFFFLFYYKEDELDFLFVKKEKKESVTNDR